MRIIALFLLVQLLLGCSTGVIVHDGNRVAELIVDFLSGFKTSSGIELSYEWTDDKFKEDVTLSTFSQTVASIRNNNQGADIQLAGYEVFGSVEVIAIYANSTRGVGNIFFKFVLVGDKTRDYYLLNFETSDYPFSKEGIYREYGQMISIHGV
ncbi:MAG: hypothetical protein ACI8P9_003604 [Parasphingorhabdus sp.]|jgi:hypothetical protein